MCDEIERLKKLITLAAQSSGFPEGVRASELLAQIVEQTRRVWSEKGLREGFTSRLIKSLTKNGMGSCQARLGGVVALQIGDIQKILASCFEIWEWDYSKDVSIKEAARLLHEAELGHFSRTRNFFIPQKGEALLTQMEKGRWPIANGLTGIRIEEALEATRAIFDHYPSFRHGRETVLEKQTALGVRHISFVPHVIRAEVAFVEFEGSARALEETLRNLPDDPFLRFAAKRWKKFGTFKLLGCHSLLSEGGNWGKKGWSLWAAK